MEDKADQSPDAAPLPADGPRKRPAPTIDLTASSVSDRPAAASETTTDQVVSDKKDSPWWPRFSAGKPESPSPEDPAESPSSDVHAPSQIKTAIVAALSGAAMAALVAAGWTAFVSNSSNQDDIVQTQNLAIDALSARIAKLEARPVAASSREDDNKLQSAVGALGNEVTALRKDADSLRAQINTISSAVAALKSSASDSSSPQALSSIEDRLAKLEQTVAAPLQRASEAVDDMALRRAVAATTLDQSVIQGAPYASALAAVTKLGSDTDALKPLQAFAATGIPSAADMSRDLINLLKPLETARESLPQSASLVDRFKASVVSLVRVTRVDQDGSDRSTLLVRAKAAAQRQDISEAKAIVMRLPENDRVALREWIDKAEAREAALSAARQFAQQASGGLPRSPADASQ